MADKAPSRKLSWLSLLALLPHYDCHRDATGFHFDVRRAKRRDAS
jgi:hypothetical protein